MKLTNQFIEQLVSKRKRLSRTNSLVRQFKINQIM